MTGTRAVAPVVPRHPAFAPFVRWIGEGETPSVPPLAQLNEWAEKAGLALPDGRALRFVRAPARRLPAIEYERGVIERGEIATRAASLHDACNALVWLAFPRTKAALAAAHVRAATGTTGPRRGPMRDAATLLDEHGAIVLAHDPDLVAAWRARAWSEVFGARAPQVRVDMSIAVIGHGLLAKLARPYPGLTAHVLVLTVARGLARSVDELAAEWLNIRGVRTCPGDWLPLPLAAWPGWSGAEPPRFGDERIFRPARAAAAVTAN